MERMEKFETDITTIASIEESDNDTKIVVLLPLADDEVTLRNPPNRLDSNQTSDGENKLVNLNLNNG